MIAIKRDGLIPRLYLKEEPNQLVVRRYYYGLDHITNELLTSVKAKVHQKTGHETIFQIVKNINIGNSELILRSMQTHITNSQVWNKKVNTWTIDSEEFIELRDIFTVSKLPVLIEAVSQYINDYYKNSFYIAPVRASAERYYRIQDLAVDEVDFQGRNLAMFIKNLNTSQRKNFEKWSIDNFGFSPYISLSEGHISLKIRTSNLVHETNLADTGFGYSQILPIITELWMLINSKQKILSNCLVKRTFTIEQPELHLHPSLQAKLIDAFLASINIARKNGIDLKIIIETHSETIINRLGHHIYKKNENSEDILIYIFEKGKQSIETNIIQGLFDEHGFLLNWPLGFFEPEEVKEFQS